MMNPSYEEVDLLVASLGALSKLTTTGKNTAVYTKLGISEGELVKNSRWTLHCTEQIWDRTAALF